MRAMALLPALAALLAATPAAGAPRIQVTLEPDTLTVGDRVEALIELSAGPSELAGEPRFPAWGERWGGAEILEAGPVERLRSGYRQRLTLTAFRTGRVELPPKAVAVPGPVETAELRTPADLALTVESVLPPDAETGDLAGRPPAPPRSLPFGGAFWWTAGSLAALALGAVALARARHRDPEGASPAASPLEELARRLDAASRELEVLGAAEGHAVLSRSFRRYLGRRLGFPAVESTTTEIRRELRRLHLAPDVEARADELLRACDRVKFAREPVATATLTTRIEAVREVAHRLEEDLRPAVPGARDGTGGEREVAA